MTVSSTIDKNIYVGDGSTTIFPFTFKILDNSQISIIFKNNLTEEVDVQTTGFTVLGAPGIGNVTFTTAPDSNTTITLLRNMPIVQETDYNEYDPFPAETHEAALDYLTMICQQLNESVSRAFQFDSATSADLTFDYNLPNPTLAPGQYVRVNATATGFEYAAFIDLVDYSFPSTQGILVKNGTLTAITRSVTGTSGEITATNGDGTAGNPTLSLPASLTFTSKIITGGSFKTFTMVDATDVTKKLNFVLSGITTGTTRSITLPDASGTLALLTNNLSVFAATTSAQLASIISDETGTGSLVFSASPTFTGTTVFNALSCGVASFSGNVSFANGTTVSFGSGMTIGFSTNASFLQGLTVSTGSIVSTPAITLSGSSNQLTINGTVYTFPITQAIMETGTSTTNFVTPGLQKNHPLHPKIWANASGTTLVSSSGVSGVSSSGTGVFTYAFSTSMSTTSYCAIPVGYGGAVVVGAISRGTGGVTVSYFTTAGVATNPTEHSIIIMGDQ